MLWRSTKDILSPFVLCLAGYEIYSISYARLWDITYLLRIHITPVQNCSDKHSLNFCLTDTSVRCSHYLMILCMNCMAEQNQICPSRSRECWCTKCPALLQATDLLDNSLLSVNTVEKPLQYLHTFMQFKCVKVLLSSAFIITLQKFNF